MIWIILLTLFTPSVAIVQGRPLFIINQNKADFYRLAVVDGVGKVGLDAWFSADDACTTNCTLIPAEAAPPVLYNDNYTLYLQTYTIGVGYSEWSEGLAFVVNEPPPSVSGLQLLALNDANGVPCVEGACQSLRPEFTLAYHQNEQFSGEWVEFVLTDADRVVHQEWLQVDTDVRCRHDICRLSVPFDLFPDVAYTWYVRSWGPGGASVNGYMGYTRPRSPTEGDPNNIAHFVIQPEDHAPTDLHFDLQVYSWQHMDPARWYAIEIEDQSGGLIHKAWYPVINSDVVMDVNTVYCAVRCQFMPEMGLANGQYQWRVRYWNGKLSKFASANFEVKEVLLSVPTDLVYDGGLFTWTHVADAKWYEVVAHSPVLHITYWVFAPKSCRNICLARLEQVLDIGEYEWSVRAWSAGSFGQWASRQSFSINNGLDGMQAIAPSAGFLVSDVRADVTFRWQAAVEQTQAEIRVEDQSGQVVLQQVVESHCGQTCFAFLPLYLPNGHYDWAIKVGDDKWLPMVGSPDIVINGLPIASVDLIGPLAGEVMATDPALSWLDAPHASWYRLGITNLETNDYRESWHFAPDICQTTCMLLLPLEAGRYRWSVSGWGPGSILLTRSGVRTFIRL